MVQHQRKYGVTKFGLDRFINGFLDLAALAVVGKFGRRPMHFRAAGTLMFVLSAILLAYLGGYKLWAMSAGETVRLITDNPLFYILLALNVIGVQLFGVTCAELLLKESNKK